MAPPTMIATTNTETSTKASSPSPSEFRFTNSQKDRTLIHPSLPQPEPEPLKVPPTETPEVQHYVKPHRSHSFVVCADTQFGMTERNLAWETEMEYSVSAVDAINRLQKRPLFCCGKPPPPPSPSPLTNERHRVTLTHTFFCHPSLW
jgi:hypothetical protein